MAHLTNYFIANRMRKKRTYIYIRILIEIVDSCSFHFAVKYRWHCNLIAFSLVGVSRKYKRKWWKFSPRGCRSRTRWKFIGSSCGRSGAWWSHLYNRHKFAAIKYPWMRAWSHVKSPLITRSPEKEPHQDPRVLCDSPQAWLCALQKALFL